jgi:ABC-2 type transport system ATP-binding protein
MSTSFVTISNLTKTFEHSTHPALSEINAHFSKGKITCLVGPDGAGKTTLIRILSGLLTPTKGSVTVNGLDTEKDTTSLHQMIGYMPQKFGLYEDLSVMQNLNLYADLQGLSSAEKTAQFEKLLNFTQLKPFTSRLAGYLSGGMKQKLGLACTLLRAPKLLLLDEPTVGVDPISRRELWAMIIELLKDDITVVCSTSYLDEVEHCQEVLLLNEGKVLYLGNPVEFTDKLKNRTFLLEHAENKRQTLSQMIQSPFVMDGLIQGSALRIVLKEESANNNQAFEVSTKLTPTPPRFEDAFIDSLGGGPKTVSPLAKLLSSTTKNNAIVVEADALTKCFGSFTAADHISFKVKRGEIFGLLGPNGAGKSTTFKMLCGLLKPTSGKSTVAGISLQKAPSAARAKIGYMAQKFSLYGSMTVLQNLNFFCGIYPLYKDKAKDVIDEMVSTFFLKPYLDTKACELPLGFKQRLSLACSIMHRPEVLFLDEPTSGVDPITRREFWGHINAMVATGVCIIVTTHFMDEAEYCDRIGLINRGKLIQIGTPDELKTCVTSNLLPHPTLEDAFIQLSSKGALK